MEYSLDNYTLWKGTVDENHFSKCITFMVPPAVSNPLAFIVLSAQGSSITFHERRSVALRNKSTTVFVQTDKSTYNPGQNVKFRTVALDTDLKPVNKMYTSIYIQDPKGNRIAQWLNQKASFGILQLEFPTVEDANLGTYQIIVEDKPKSNAYHWFSLEQYVLPRYEVTIEAPKKVSPFDEEIRLHACAKYTYGQPVQGKVQLRVCRQYYYDPRCNQDSKGICEAVSAQLVVTETGTGVQISRSTYIPVYQARKTIIFENTDQYYKWGLPYTGLIRLRDEDGNPLANSLIFLEFNGEIIANYTTDMNGTAQFSIDTSDLFETQYKLKAVYQSDQCTDYPWLDNYQIEVVQYIQRFFSKSGSFLKIEPVLEELPCGKQKSIIVHYILNKDQYKNIKFSISLNITQNLAPRTRLLAYSLQPHGDLIADSISLEIEKCFRNKVNLQFSEKQALPASKINLHLSAEATSFCAMRAVDKSVLLLRQGSDLSPENVYNRMPYLELFGYYYNGLNLDDSPKDSCIELRNTFFNGLYYQPVNVTNDGNVYDIFQNMGLKVVIETVRTKFPETWIWDLIKLDASGIANLSYTVPDTITEWQASAFCVENDAGFGISRPVSLIAFQSFFLELTLPYSAVRGEEIILKVNVFNHLNYCIEVILGTVNFTVTAEAKANELTVGRRDTVIKPLLVEASFSVLGDILGTAMRNVENLVQMPFGCGEQNIAMYLSNLRILNYLNNTNQLTEEKKSRFLRNLNSGYQRQLFYQLSNGAFGTFGGTNEEGNLWLTALVYKAFALSKPHLYIDDNILNQALIWIASKQKADGCFQPIGKIKIPNSNPIIRNGLSCLDAALNRNLENIYENAILAYTYSLAGEAEKQKRLLDLLIKSAVRTGGLTYWEREKKPAGEIFPSFYSRAPSAEIEITSYVLLAWLRKQNLAQEDMIVISQMARWLVRQQNYYGGFSSTQDTPVALQAISEYGILTFTKDAQNTVVISATGTFKQHFQVDSSNSILLQQATLPSIPGNYSVEVNGSGCVYVYSGERNTSNMAIIDMKMLSGFVPVPSSLDQLRNKVMRLEIRNDHVFLYLAEVSAKEITFTITLEETHHVTNSKPAQLKIYDYYETEEFALAEYNTPCQVSA
uniref:Ovostatin-like n=1 Tax=Ailuropoda melanoleuca TaxID=9646 RepID=A0A7N5JHF9_AILME